MVILLIQRTDFENYFSISSLALFFLQHVSKIVYVFIYLFICIYSLVYMYLFTLFLPQEIKFSENKNLF